MRLIKIILIPLVFLSGCVPKEGNKVIFDEGVVGHLKIPGTNIDYDIISREYYIENNEEDLKDNILFNYDKDDIIKTDNNIKLGKIWGHNILNVSPNPLITYEGHSKFEQLLSFTNYNFALENQRFHYTTDAKMEFVIFAVSFVPSEYLYYDLNLDYDTTLALIEEARDYSIYDYDIDVTPDDKIIYLTTCTRAYNGRNDVGFVVFGRLVRKNETKKTYNISYNNDRKEVK